MKYKTRDKIGAFIWFAAYGVTLSLALAVIFSPLLITSLRILIIPTWAIVVSMIFLYFAVFWVSDIVQLWLEQFEDWVRKKFDL